jgi:thiol-disulfide isomerase/thioredoxin
VSRGTRAALALGLVAAAGLAGCHESPAPGAREATGVASSSLPAIPDQAAAQSAAQQAVPEQLPELGFPDRDGTVRRLSDFRGRPLLVNFWATWCEPCRREIPLIESLRRTSNARLQVVGIAVDERDPALKYAHTMGIDYPVLVAGEDGGLAALRDFGMEGELPFSVFADREGRIVTVKVGELHTEEARFIVARLYDLDAGRLTLSAARDQISSELRTLAIERAQRSASPVPEPRPAS